MAYVRRLALHFCFVFLFAVLVPRAFAAPANGPAPASAPQTSQSINANQSSQQAYSLPPDKLAKAIAISRIRNILDIVGALWGLIVIWLALATHFSAGLERWTESMTRRRWVQGLAFFAILLLALTIASLPLDMYGHHVSRSYGISVEGWGSWFGDQAKALGLTLAIGAPVMLLFNWIVRRWPRRYWLGAWIVSIPLLVAGTMASPFFEPLFYKFEPLAKNNAALVADLEKVVARTGTNIPPDRMLLMKASVKTNGLNAYVSGMGATKRIVVWDTTAGRIPNDRVMYIFGHESGHYVLHHIVKGMIASIIGLFFVFWACAWFSASMVRRYRTAWRISELEPEPLASRTGFVVLLFAVSIAGFILTPVNNTVSRHIEHEADVYGQEAMHGIVPDPQKTAVAAFNALGEAWLEDPSPNPFIEFWDYGHPSTKNRANFAAHYDPWANGAHGQFFEK